MTLTPISRPASEGDEDIGTTLMSSQVVAGARPDLERALSEIEPSPHAREARGALPVSGALAIMTAQTLCLAGAIIIAVVARRA